MRSTIIVILQLLTAGIFTAGAQNFNYAYANVLNAPRQFILNTENNTGQQGNRMLAKTILLTNGVKLEYMEQGNPKGTPVVLLHGFTDSYHSYDLMMPHLPSSLHVFSITLRGHGNSDKPQLGYNPLDFANDIAIFLDMFKIKKAVIVGHSMGSLVAQQFAIKYPAYTSALVLVGAFARFTDKPEMLEFQKTIHTLTDPIDPAFAKEFQQSTLKQEVPADFFETAVQQSLKVPARVWKSIIDELVVIDFTKQLTNVKKPALIIWGDQDLYCPVKDQLDLAVAINGCRLLTYKDIGHAVHWEAPQRFAKDLTHFINSIK